jgi:hypothetical protein
MPGSSDSWLALKLDRQLFHGRVDQCAQGQIGSEANPLHRILPFALA